MSKMLQSGIMGRLIKTKFYKIKCKSYNYRPRFTVNSVERPEIIESTVSLITADIVSLII